jgi:predicted dinucleotide-binding enzyme
VLNWRGSERKPGSAIQPKAESEFQQVGWGTLVAHSVATSNHSWDSNRMYAWLQDVAATVVRDAGFDPVDAYPLRMARSTEPFALLVAQLAYEGDAGPELAYRFERFGQ